MSGTSRHLPRWVEAMVQPGPYTIKDVVRLTGATPHQIRSWTVAAGSRARLTNRGRRYATYTDEHIRLIRSILEGKKERTTLAAIAASLRQADDSAAIPRKARYISVTRIEV